MFRFIFLTLMGLVLLQITGAMRSAAEPAPHPDQVQPYAENPRYWQYRGRPMILIGGSKDDNLFQISDLEAHLNLLANVGGNYIRNTMSSRDEGNRYPFARLPDGRYDLDRWDEEYWSRFDNLLRLSQALGIIVQIEVWDRFDFSRKEWDTQPFNPKNNINYSFFWSDFAEAYPAHPNENKQPFFFTTPKQRNNTRVLRYQQRFVDEMLRRSLRYPNILYCLDNETSGEESWSSYWAEYIRRRAEEAGVRVYVTEMWDHWELNAAQHRRTFDHPERYDFADISQNNHQKGDKHWDNLQWVHRYFTSKPWPLNTVKTYGADRSRFGTTADGLERWWRHLIGGSAAVRFHRPPAGIGLDEQAQMHIRAARSFLSKFDMVRATPDSNHEMLKEREANEAFATRIPNEAYAIYFPKGGEVRLQVPVNETFTLTWLDIGTARWADRILASPGEDIRLTAPGQGHWLALIAKAAR